MPKRQDLQPQPFGEGCWAVEQYCIMITQHVNVFICAHCLFYVLVNLEIQCDIVRPLPFFSSTHFSHYPRLMIWMLLTHLPSVSTRQLKVESFWKDIWSCGFALGRSRLRLLVCIFPTARDPCSVKSTGLTRGEGWKEMGIRKLLGPSVPDFPIYVT